MSASFATATLVYTRDCWLGRRWLGDMVAMSTVDVRSIGAGGGSIAWIDAGGLLRVGPQAPARCRARRATGAGGDQPTVTDAAWCWAISTPTISTAAG